MDVVEYILNHVGLCDGCDYVQPSSAPGGKFDIDLKHSLEPLSPGKRGKRTFGFYNRLRFSTSRVLALSLCPPIERGHYETAVLGVRR